MNGSFAGMKQLSDRAESQALCPAGTFSSNGKAPECTLCPGNSVALAAGSTACGSCPVGTIPMAGKSACQPPCLPYEGDYNYLYSPAGQYVPGPNDTNENNGTGQINTKKDACQPEAWWGSLCCIGFGSVSSSAFKRAKAKYIYSMLLCSPEGTSSTPSYEACVGGENGELCVALPKPSNGGAGCGTGFTPRDSIGGAALQLVSSNTSAANCGPVEKLAEYLSHSVTFMVGC